MGTSDDLLLEILEELKKMRFALQERKTTSSGGAYPANPKIDFQKQPDGKWKGKVPEGVSWKPCKDGCGTEICWMDTQFGPRPCTKQGEQHYCPNYVKGGDRTVPEADPTPPADALDFNSDAVPF